MTEREWQRVITDLCDWLHLRYYHTYDSRRSQAGFPDLVIVGNAVLYVELKSAKGRLSNAQRAWLADLTACGQEAVVWRPDDLHVARVRLTELARRT